MTLFTGAVSRHRLFSPQGYNIPKPKFMYFVRFVSPYLSSYTSRNLSFFVKRMDRLQVSYDVSEMNQYNKKRLVQGKIQYNPLTFGFYDTVDGTAAKMVQSYNSFYFGDFNGKDNQSWNYDVIGSNFEFSKGWGLQGNRSPNNSNFFSRIEVYEIYGLVYSQLSFINPKFTSVDMQPLVIDDSQGNEINISSKYEGAVFEAIAQPVTPELADLFGLPYHNDVFSSLLGGLNIPGFDIGSGVGLPGQSIFSSVLNAFGGSAANINLINSILNGQLPSVVSDNTVFQTINGVFGSFISGGLPSTNIFAPISSIGAILPDISSRLGVGDPVRDVSSTVFNSVGNVFGGLLDF